MQSLTRTSVTIPALALLAACASGTDSEPLVEPPGSEATPKAEVLVAGADPFEVPLAGWSPATPTNTTDQRR